MFPVSMKPITLNVVLRVDSLGRFIKENVYMTLSILIHFINVDAKQSTPLN